MSLNKHRIRFVEVLGHGGFGTVYLADVQSPSGVLQRLAVKILSAQRSQDADMVARQRDEARLLAQLNHHAIVTVFALTTIDGRPAVLMEYVDGVDLSVLMQAGPLPLRGALQILGAAAAALHVVHTATSPQTGQRLDMVHRDIKPANLLISRHGGVKVLDFGVARARLEREGRTGSAQFGTVRYMAPEQWLSARVGPAVDIFALGVCAVELLTQDRFERAPLAEQAFGEHVEAALDGLPTDLPQRAAVRALLQQMMAFEPDERPDAQVISEQLLGLSDALTGEGLVRFARRAIPALLEVRRSRHADSHLPGGFSFRQDFSVAAPPAVVPLAETAAHTGSVPLAAPRAPARRMLWTSLVASVLVLLGWLGRSEQSLQEVESSAAADAVPAPGQPDQGEADHATVWSLNTAKSIAVTPPSTPAAAAVSAPAEVASLVAAPSPSPVNSTPPVNATPAVQPAAAASAVAAVAPRREVVFGASDCRAEIYLDHEPLGKTPRSQFVSLGAHLLRMTCGAHDVALTIEVAERTAKYYTLHRNPDRIISAD